MKNIKLKMASLILVNVMIVSIALSIAFHLIISGYIWTEVGRTFELNNGIMYLESDALSAVIKEQSSVFSTVNLTIDYNYQGGDEIIDLCLASKEKLLKGDIVKSNLEEMVFFIKCTRQSQQGFSVSIANTTSVSNLATMVNRVFVIIITLAGIVFSMIALYVGSKLENTQAKLKSFFANTTHELKTPLMSIQGYGEAIQQNVLDPQLASDVIIKKSDEMNALITKILELSKIDSGETIRGKEPLDLNELFYQILEDLRLDEETVALDFGSEKNSIRGDEIQLYQLFSNIVTNAKRYMNGWIKVRIIPHHGHYVIEIENDGPQIDAKDLPYLFERFYKGKDGNTGIGLAISAEIAKIYKGSVTISNTKQGVKTTIMLKK